MKAQTKTERLEIRLESDLKLKLKQLAISEGCTVTDLLTPYIEQIIASSSNNTTTDSV